VFSRNKHVLNFIKESMDPEGEKRLS